MLTQVIPMSIREIITNGKRQEMRLLGIVGFPFIPPVGTLIVFEEKNYKISQALIDFDIMEEETYLDTGEVYICLFVVKVEEN